MFETNFYGTIKKPKGEIKLRQYLELCERILLQGTKKSDRTGTGTLSVFGHQMRFDLSQGFPLITTKDMSGVRLDGIIEELLWFLRGETNIKPLVEKGVNIWNRDAYQAYKKGMDAPNGSNAPLTYKEFVAKIRESEAFAKVHGDLGRVYGGQWRSWRGADGSTVDQIANVIDSLKTNPDSRRHIVTAWNPAEVDNMVLPPCHTIFQFYVSEGKLSCQLYQRSGDVFLGVPYNIASYSLLTMMIADQVGLEYGEFIHTLGDAHIYLNHVEQVLTQIRRSPKPLPTMWIGVAKDIFSYKREFFSLSGYDPHPAIVGEQSS